MSGRIMLRFFVVFILCLSQVLAVFGFEVNLTSTQPSCSNSNDGVITILLPKSSSEYSVKLYDKTPAVKQKTLTSVSTSDSIVVFNDLGPKKYYVIVQDNDGNSIRREIVLKSPAPFKYKGFKVISTPTENEANGIVEIELIGGTPPYTLTWNSKATHTLQINNLDYGAFTCTVDDANNCGPLNPTVLFTKPKTNN